MIFESFSVLNCNARGDDDGISTEKKTRKGSRDLY